MVTAQNTIFKHASIALPEVLATGGRLDASVFNIEARQARELIAQCGWPSVDFTDPLLMSTASYPGRFKRNYVSKKIGLPFILPSQISEINPQPVKWIFGLKDGDLNNLYVNQWDLLLTRSGTIGQCTLAGMNLAGKLMSDDLIRVVPQEKFQGYLYMFVKSTIGQLLLKTNNYGAVIQHIEPEHLSGIKVPIANEPIIESINRLIISSFKLRDESNILIKEAHLRIITELQLPEINEITTKLFRKFDVSNFNVPIAQLNERMDASFHNPLVLAIEKILKSNAKEITTVGDKKVSHEIILPGRFKRIYVEKGFGVPFIGGKQIGNLDPRTEKYLSLQGHGERIKNQLTIKENQVLITCSGTIGRVNIAPRHWDGWTASQHIIRITPNTDWMGGYLYAWLSTDYGREMIRKFTYGSVVDEVDNEHFGNVIIPLLDITIMQKIGELILLANEKRYNAFLKETEALKVFNEKVYGLYA